MQFLSRTNSPTRVLFGGDFNSTPGGAVYRLISTGKLPKTDSVWQLDERVKSEDLSIENPMENLTGTPEYTNYTANSKKEGFVGCLDYIWGLGISQIRTCPMPSHEKVIKYTALPSKISPSDHLPIITDIRVKM
uniref:Endonuclease/exonuclease/phosphatase domain-containing protein n=1 Tax=Caenorhabditis japonica TaxID=281687 RepID=A0A8R1DZZ6_CAEJA